MKARNANIGFIRAVVDRLHMQIECGAWADPLQLLFLTVVDTAGTDFMGAALVRIKATKPIIMCELHPWQWR